MLFIAFASIISCRNLQINTPDSASILETCSGIERCIGDATSITITGSEFKNIANSEETEGGSVSLTYCVLTCTNARFISCSTASTNGGAIYFFNQKESGKKCAVTSCYFSQCHAGKDGGAIYFSQSKHESSEFVNCVFESNSADGTGAAFYGSAQSLSLKNCSFDNVADSNKGPLLTFQNTCQNNFAWANTIDDCKFRFVCGSAVSNSVISFLGSDNLKAIEISGSCFSLEGSSTSSFAYINTLTPLLFAGSNAFSVQQAQSISGSSINVTSPIQYNSNQCGSPSSGPSKQPTSNPTSNPTSKPSSVPTYFPSSNPTTIPTKNIDVNNGNYSSQDRDEAEKEYNSAFKNFIIIIAVCVSVFILIVITLVVVLIYVKIKYPSDAKIREAKSEISRGDYKTQLGEELF